MKKLPFVFLLLGFLFPARAQEDEVKIDHPIFVSLPGFTLYDHEKQDFGAYSFCDVNGEDYVIEGQVSFYYYECDDVVNPKLIISRFQEIGDSLKASMYGDGEHQLYMVLQTNNRRIYVDLFAEDFYYTLNIVERGELKSDIEAESLLKDLNEIGKAVLYFNFKRHECELTSDCREIIEMIARALKSEPTMGISIDAYTDNIGRSDENLELSRKRAETLYNELVKQGIDPQRMVYNGFGEKDPIADNNTVMGRAFNDRIELVKK
ncbi:MAG: OmpA family protein [Bacteroidales bacterium]|nr:OmpA family protein [Bacteroidales bacterium]